MLLYHSCKSNLLETNLMQRSCLLLSKTRKCHYLQSQCNHTTNAAFASFALDFWLSVNFVCTVRHQWIIFVKADCINKEKKNKCSGWIISLAIICFFFFSFFFLCFLFTFAIFNFRIKPFNLGTTNLLYSYNMIFTCPAVYHEPGSC